METRKSLPQTADNTVPNAKQATSSFLSNKDTLIRTGCPGMQWSHSPWSCLRVDVVLWDMV